MAQRRNTMRWSLIGVITALAVALAFVVTNIDGGTRAEAKPGPKPSLTAASKSAAPSKSTAKPAPPALKGIGWWPTDEKSGGVARDAAGKHPADLKDGAGWTKGEQGGALLLNGTSGYADAGAPIVETVGRDYSAAAAVRLDADGFRTAVSLDGAGSSVFFLQYVADYRRFSFSFSNARALANLVEAPKLGRWYHLVGTYSHSEKKLRVYVDGVAAGEVLAPDNPEKPAGNLVIGRGKYQGKPTDFWPGAIADVHVYDRALTPAEIAALAAREPSR
ncbi:LamG domain-containing protein [Streptomyces sp. NBC_01244]|uniref:LamG domain-containing protein n=1 Tax=Streptomyces sp. NBC_01244 TaxID=2903797 RepID=UPI002E129108|nr:LamG domain-containing protein [Streptomyces sp. NBC_01244]